MPNITEEKEPEEKALRVDAFAVKPMPPAGAGDLLQTRPIPEGEITDRIPNGEIKDLGPEKLQDQFRKKELQTQFMILG